MLARRWTSREKSGTALHRALARRHVDVVALLVARGADVNVDNQLLGTPLHVAAGTGKEALVLLLLDNGADLAVARGSDGFTPLHVAAQAGRTPVVRLLLDRGADVNVLSHGEIGAPALHLAELRGRTELAQMLRDGGATAPSVEPIATLMAAASARARASGRGQLHVLPRGRPGGATAGGGPVLVGNIWPCAGIVARIRVLRCFATARRGVGRGGARYAFVAHPMATVPGTSMQFKGLANAEERADLIAYLRTLSDAPSPAPP